MHVDLQALPEVLGDTWQLPDDKLSELYLPTFLPFLVEDGVELLLVLGEVGSRRREGPVSLVVLFVKIVIVLPQRKPQKLMLVTLANRLHLLLDGLELRVKPGLGVRLLRLVDYEWAIVVEVRVVSVLVVVVALADFVW